MIDHTGIGVADVGHSAAFYDEALGTLGLRRVMQMPEGRPSMRELLAVRSAVFLQDRRWNRVAQGLVHGQCQETRLDFKKYISARFRTGY